MLSVKIRGGGAPLKKGSTSSKTPGGAGTDTRNLARCTFPASRMTFPLYDWCRARCVVGLDGCEVRLCDPRARVRPCVPSVSRVCRLVSFYRYRYLRLWENCGNGPMEHALLAGTERYRSPVRRCRSEATARIRHKIGDALRHRSLKCRGSLFWQPRRSPYPAVPS